MNIELELCGPLRKPGKERRIKTSCPDGTRVETLLEKELDYPPAQHRFLRIVQDGQSLSPKDTVGDGGPIQVFLRLGGG